MFTGIIEEVGTIKQIQKNPVSAVITIAADTVLEQTKIGDSIAVNGVCLTVTDLKAGSFTADACMKPCGVFAWQCPHRQSGESGTRNAVRRKIWRTYCIGAY